MLIGAYEGSGLRVSSVATEEVVGSGTNEDWGARNDGSDRAIRIWNVSNGKILKKFAGHEGCGYVAVFTPDGTKLVTGGLDALIRIWDLDH